MARNMALVDPELVVHVDYVNQEESKISEEDSDGLSAFSR